MTTLKKLQALDVAFANLESDLRGQLVLALASAAASEEKVANETALYNEAALRATELKAKLDESIATADADTIKDQEEAAIVDALFAKYVPSDSDSVEVIA